MLLVVCAFVAISCQSGSSERTDVKLAPTTSSRRSTATTTTTSQPSAAGHSSSHSAPQQGQPPSYASAPPAYGGYPQMGVSGNYHAQAVSAGWQPQPPPQAPPVSSFDCFDFGLAFATLTPRVAAGVQPRVGRLKLILKLILSSVLVFSFFFYKSNPCGTGGTVCCASFGWPSVLSPTNAAPPYAGGAAGSICE